MMGFGALGVPNPFWLIMHRKIEAKIVNPLLGSVLPTPTYGTDGSAALDLRACISEKLVIPSRGHMLIKTGLAINMKDPGLVAIVASRSGLSLKHHVHVAQGIGVVDSDFHGEIGVILANDGPTDFTVEPGDRIAQLMFQPVVQVRLDFVTDFSSVTSRGEGGFGSTGMG